MAEFGDSRLENVVEYKIFDIHFVCGDSSATFETQGALYDILSYSQSLIGCDYIWQNGCFNLRSCKGLASAGGEHLEGSVNFGDNIEDEWFIVYLLTSITNRFPHIAVTVKENDEELLLIESADYLPKWLEPETSENRVFLYQGKLHIIPLPIKPSEITIFPIGKPTIEQALKILKENPEKTVVSPWIEDPVLKRIQEYPNKVKSSLHHVLCYLPMTVKFLLEIKPSLIAAAILAFVNRDPVDVKTCQQLKYFSFESPIPHRVCFTKCLYAQLVKQDFVPDKSALKLPPEISSTSYKGHVIGLQLTYGFEILHSHQSASKDGIPTPNSPGGQQWEKYLTALKRHDYFKGELVGSKLYGQLMDDAKEYFSRNCLSSEENPRKLNEIEKLLQEMPSSYEPSTEEVSEIPPDDDESWLEISPEELETMLLRYGNKAQLSRGADDLHDVVDGMNSFVETISGYEGAEFPSEPLHEVDIQLDPDKLLKLLKDLLVNPGHQGRHVDESSEDEESSESTVEDKEYHEYTNAMDKELTSTHVGKSFAKMENDDPDEESKDTSSESVENEYDVKPIDIDLNLVQNFLESYTSQDGTAGPVSNILNSMGISLPNNNCSETDH